MRWNRRTLLPSMAVLSLFAHGCLLINYDSAGSESDAANNGDSAGGDALDREPLVQRGVIVRYTLREDIRSGSIPTDIGDLPLAIQSPEAGLSHEVAATGNGLRFAELGSDAGACGAISGTDVERDLDGSMTGTWEIVADVDGGLLARSRLGQIGIGDEWSFALGYGSDDQHFVFAHNISVTDTRRWFFDAIGAGRVVYTMVYNSQETAEADRAVLYVNGSRIDVVSSLPIPLNEVLELGPASLCIGNRVNGARAPLGVIYYAALYASALSPAELQANARRLLDFDD